MPITRSNLGFQAQNLVCKGQKLNFKLKIWQKCSILRSNFLKEMDTRTNWFECLLVMSGDFFCCWFHDQRPIFVCIFSLWGRILVCKLKIWFFKVKSWILSSKIDRNVWFWGQIRSNCSLQGPIWVFKLKIWYLKVKSWILSSKFDRNVWFGGQIFGF